MKLKLRYFIRGLGIGIVFTAIVMSLSLQASRSRIIRENSLTKEEIMEKAMGYGMIMDSSEDTNSVDETSQEEQTQNEADTQKEDKNLEETQDNKESQDVEETKNDDVQDGDNEEDKDKNDKDSDDKNLDKEEESDKDDSVISIDYISIKITSGMTATSVGTLLKEKNIIEDANEFKTYMSEQGYSSKIQTGEYLIPVNATYKKIADIITEKK